MMPSSSQPPKLIMSQVSTQDIIANSTNLGNQDRRAQNNAQLYHCIKKSSTPEVERKILAEREQYHINGVPSGPLLLKLLTHGRRHP